MTIELHQKKCVPCEGYEKPLSPSKVADYLRQVDGWQTDNKTVWKEFKFKNFKETMAFVNNVADLAEQEGHHPDMEVHYSRVKIELWTHAINGLSENDFILASKIDKIQ